MICFQTLTPNACPYWKGLYHALSALHPVEPLWQVKQKSRWQAINTPSLSDNDKEVLLTNWLIETFNRAFCHSKTFLVRGDDEPLYLAQKNDAPAQIIFAHGYFSSALHEISHWCIAGTRRRQFDDFGYWYCPDGRDKLTQEKFEQVEIRPQAIECLLTLATNRPFNVSVDNLDASFDTSDSTFAQDVYQTAHAYLVTPQSLPKDAQKMLVLLLSLCQDNQNLSPP